jgi:hypothetical protein
MLDRDLRASLAKLGPLQPGLEWNGELVDGRRRQPLCIELEQRGELPRPFVVHVASTLEEACSMLWPLHPARALLLARSDGERSLLQLAAMCGATPAAVARELEPLRPKRSHHSNKQSELERARTQARMLRRLVTMEPELYAYAKKAANQIGHGSFPRLVRDSLWKTIRDTLHDAPIRAPARVQNPNGRRR